jgi:hypothetical protein
MSTGVVYAKDRRDALEGVLGAIRECPTESELNQKVVRVVLDHLQTIQSDAHYQALFCPMFNPKGITKKAARRERNVRLVQVLYKLSTDANAGLTADHRTRLTAITEACGGKVNRKPTTPPSTNRRWFD